jgi:hypothetical protein
VLKLADFGITKAGFKKSGVRADAAAWRFAPSDIGAFWRPADDVYQVGLLMLTLLAGEEVDNTVGRVDVNQSSRGYGLLQAISWRSRRGPNARRPHLICRSYCLPGRRRSFWHRARLRL